MAAKHWMQKASEASKAKGTKGSFSRSAARAGKSTSEYAHEKEHAPGLVGKRARLALAYASARK